MNAREVLLGGVSAIALGAAVISAPVSNALAQSALGSNVTQSAVRADAATFFAESFGGRTTCSTSQDTVANLTVTVPANGANYAYITGIYFEGLANATGATSTTVWSSTNLAGVNNAQGPAWLTPVTASAAANPTNPFFISEIYPTGLKSAAPGTAVTIVPQATTASAFLCAHAVGYYNPQ